MADEPERQPSPGSASREAPLSVSVQIVSPSPGVPNPLAFPDLPVSTTVQELKEKIRGSLPILNPAIAQLRLIYRGKLLVPELTLETVFGTETIRNENHQVIHLAVQGIESRSTFSRQSNATPIRPDTPSPATGPAPTSTRPTTSSNTIGGPNETDAIFRLARHRAAMAAAAAQTPHLNDHVNRMQENIQNIQRRLRSLQGAHAPLPQNRDSAEARLNDMMARASLRPSGLPSLSGGNTHTSIREGVSADGTQWRVTVSESYTTSSDTPAATPGNLNVLVQSDAPPSAAPAHRPHHHHHHRPHHHHHHHHHPRAGLGGRGATAPADSAQSGDALLARLQGTLNSIAAQRTQPTESGHGGEGPEVYILNSASGPEAILINNNVGNAVYATPFSSQTSPITTGSGLPPLPGSAQPALFPTATTAQDALERWREDARRREELFQRLQERANQQRQQHQQRLPLLRGQGVAVELPALRRRRAVHPNNQGAAALLAAIWPHIWLIVRMMLLLWWFTSPDTSWARWLSVIAMGLAVIVINTGVLNGFAENAWQPVRRHLERLLVPHPQAAAGGDAPHQPQQQQQQQEAGRPGGQDQPAAAAAATAQQAEPDPAQAAVRLVARRREANANWLMTQVRRVERASLLFLASIAPGVAERHIATLEAEARAERQRREAAAAAAAAAAAEAEAAAAAAAATTDADGDAATDGDAVSGAEAQNVGEVGVGAGAAQQPQRGPEGLERVEENLIQV